MCKLYSKPFHTIVSLEKGDNWERFRITIHLPLADGWFERVRLNVIGSENFNLNGVPYDICHKQNAGTSLLVVASRTHHETNLDIPEEYLNAEVIFSVGTIGRERLMPYGATVLRKSKAKHYTESRQILAVFYLKKS